MASDSRQLGVRQFCKEAKEFQKHQYHLSFGEGRVRPKKAVLKFLCKTAVHPANLKSLKSPGLFFVFGTPKTLFLFF